MGAAFQGLRTSPGPDLEEINARATVNGFAFAKDGKIVYSLDVESYSGNRFSQKGVTVGLRSRPGPLSIQEICIDS